MSSIKINGKSYDIDEVLMRAELNHLLYLKQNLGIGMKSMLESLQKLEGAADEAESDEDRAAAVMNALEDEGVLNAFRGIVWMARAKASDRDADGSYLTVDAANEGVSLFDLGSDDSSEVDESSPKVDAAEPAPVTPS